jgi:muramidase (phage lysozyme)
MTSRNPMTSNQRKFLDLIAWSEGTSTNPLTKCGGWDVIVSGPDGPEVFTDFRDHPFAQGRPAKLVRAGHDGVGALYSTASGRYQLLLRYWRAYQGMLHLPDFSAASQDAVALRQIHEQGADSAIEAGDVEDAIFKCANIWASLPGNTYAQHAHPLQALLDKYSALTEAA